MGIIWAHYWFFLYSFCTWEMSIPLLGGQLPMTSRLWRRRFLDSTHSQRAFRCHFDLRAVCGFAFTVLARVRGPTKVSTVLWVRGDCRADSVFHSLAPWHLSRALSRGMYPFHPTWLRERSLEIETAWDTHWDFKIPSVRASGVPQQH